MFDPTPKYRDPDNTLLFKIAYSVAQDATGSEVSSFNGRTGAVTLLFSDVTNALGYTPADAANVVNSFNMRTGIVTLNAFDVIDALGYTPADENNVVISFNGRQGVVTLTSLDVTTALGYTPADAANVVTSFNGRQGVVTLTSLDVTTALGFTPGNVANPLSQFAATTSAQLAGVITDETGTGALVFSDNPVLVTPNLGTPSSVVLTNGTGLPIAGITGLGAGVAAFLATPSSANLAAAVTDETGTGFLVFSDNPVLVTPNLGTPSAVVLTNGTGLPISGITGLGAGIATFLATPSSANLAAALTDETGTGLAVFNTSPVFQTSLTVQNTVVTTPAEGVHIQNPTASTIAVPVQWSPALRFTGSGYRVLDSTSYSVDWRVYIETSFTGVGEVAGALLFTRSLNGAAYTKAAYINVFGGDPSIEIQGTNGFLLLPAAGSMRFTGRSRILSPSNGQFTFADNGATDFSQLNFGGTTSSYPCLARNGAVLEVMPAGSQGTTAGALRIPKAKVSPTVYEAFNIDWSGDTLRLWTEGAGGLSARNIEVITGATTHARFTAAGAALILTPLTASSTLTVTGTATFNGVSTFNAASHFAAEMDFTSTAIAGIRLNNLTTAQRNALTAAAGQLVWNTTVANLNYYNGTAWRPLVATLTKSGDQTVNGNAFRDITDLTFPMAANTDYSFEFNLAFTSVNTTTGAGWSVNGPAGATYIAYVVTYQTSVNGTGGTDVMSQRHDTGYDAMAATTSVPNSGAGNQMHVNIKGIIRNGANSGTLAARVRSELANNDIVVLQGSWGRWSDG